VRLRTLQHNPRVLDICSEHRRIYEAICDRNSIAANQAIQFHLISSKERVVQEIKQLEGEAVKS
jgi:DNA-binding FadR family transcriptional regulator